MMRRWKNRLCALTVLVLLLLPLAAYSAPRAHAYGATQQLVIKVGYAGLPFYEKAVYSLAELEALGTHSALYTFLDAGGFACYAQAEGVYLTDIMDAAGIDLSAVARCHFLTTDSGGGYFTSPTASTLFRSQYAFPLLSQYYGEPPGELGRRITDYDAVWANAVPVAAMLSLRDNFGRVDEFTAYDASLYPMTSAKQLRLFFGQSYPDEINARNMGYWVYEIDVELAGFPTMLATQEQLKLTVGSNQQAQVQVTAADELVAQAILQGLQWESDNPNAVAVDAGGVLTVVGEGEANITVRNEEYGLSATIRVTSEAGQGNGGNGNGDGTGDGTGDGSGKDNNSGDGDGQGTKPDAAENADGITQPDPATHGETPATEAQSEYIAPSENANEPQQTVTMKVRRLTLSGGGDSSGNGASGTQGGSQALGLLRQNNPLALLSAILAAAFFLGGGLFRYLQFRKNR